MLAAQDRSGATAVSRSAGAILGRPARRPLGARRAARPRRRGHRRSARRQELLAAARRTLARPSRRPVHDGRRRGRRRARAALLLAVVGALRDPLLRHHGQASAIRAASRSGCTIGCARAGPASRRRGGRLRVARARAGAAAVRHRRQRRHAGRCRSCAISMRATPSATSCSCTTRAAADDAIFGARASRDSPRATPACGSSSPSTTTRPDGTPSSEARLAALGARLRARARPSCAARRG